MRGQEGGILYHIISEKGFHLVPGSVLVWHMVAGTCSPVLWTFWPLLGCVAMNCCQLGKVRARKKVGGTQKWWISTHQVLM